MYTYVNIPTGTCVLCVYAWSCYVPLAGLELHSADQAEPAAVCQPLPPRRLQVQV